MRGTTDYNMEAYDWCVPLSELVGKIIVKLEQVNDWSELRFFCSDGTVYALYHIQECCENVYLEDVNGELSWLLDTPVLMADEVQGDTGTDEEYDTRYRWTFYRFATRKGYVDLRFLGFSNGYYSEKMDFIRIPEEAVTKQGWIQTYELERGEEQMEAESENTVCCQFDRWEGVAIRMPQWVQEYGFWLEYHIDLEDITAKREPDQEMKKSVLKEWLDQLFFPAQSEGLIRDWKKREEFLERIRACSCKLEKMSEEE
jgi:hypothetical protein